MELGVYSFGSRATVNEAGDRVTTAQAVRNLLEAIETADRVGLDFFGIGEHHTRATPASAASVVLAAAAAGTDHIRLGSAVTVLSTDDPVRIYQQFATLDALSGGRAEITAGRGSSTESFPLFGYDLNDYDRLYSEKLDLLLRLNEMAEGDRITWTGELRPSIHDMEIVPQPDAGRIPIWLGTGGNPGSTVRAAQLGMPIFYGIIGGDLTSFVPLVDLYRRAAAQVGMPLDAQRVAIASPGYVAETSEEARRTWWPQYRFAVEELGPARGVTHADRGAFDSWTGEHGAIFVGGPDEIAARIIWLHGRMGHDRHVFQLDWGRLPQADLLRSIELLGTEVRPRVERALAGEAVRV